MEQLHQYASIGFPHGIPSELDIETALGIASYVENIPLPKIKVFSNPFTQALVFFMIIIIYFSIRLYKKQKNNNKLTKKEKSFELKKNIGYLI